MRNSRRSANILQIRVNLLEFGTYRIYAQMSLWRIQRSQWSSAALIDIHHSECSGAARRCDMYRNFVHVSRYCKISWDYVLLYDSYKDLLWLAETSFHWLWQILIFTSDELNLVQDRLTLRFFIADRQLIIVWAEFCAGQVNITFFSLLPDS